MEIAHFDNIELKVIEIGIQTAKLQTSYLPESCAIIQQE